MPERKSGVGGSLDAATGEEKAKISVNGLEVGSVRVLNERVWRKLSV